jgi:enoyl-CoA hydratase
VSEPIRVQRSGGIATLTIDRPEVRNALDRPTIARLGEVLDELEADPEVGVVVLTGAGDKVFVSGADIADLKLRSKKEALEAPLSRCYQRLERFPRVTIAAINGWALGGGSELALACDIRIAAEGARFGFPETNLGIIPAGGGTQRLHRVVGLGWAKHLILTGEIIDAPKAFSIGLITRIVQREHLLEAAHEIAGQVMKRGPLAVRLAKLALEAAQDSPRSTGHLVEMLSQAICFDSRDKLEGTTAFLEKRKPEFKGE